MSIYIWFYYVFTFYVGKKYKKCKTPDTLNMSGVFILSLLSAFVNVNLCTALDNIRHILCTLLSGEERCGLFRNDIA